MHHGKVRGVGRFALARPCLGVVALVAALLGLYLGWAFLREAGRVPRLFHVAEAGTEPGWKGYDGQFVYFMAKDLNPQRVAARLDVPAYRYQRILLPVLGYLLGRGRDLGILLAVWGVAAGLHLLATGAWACRVRAWSRAPAWALLFGLWPGLLLGIRLGLPGPPMTALALLGFLMLERRRRALAGGLFLAALFAKEQAWTWVLPAWLPWWKEQPRRAAAWMAALALPWVAWQVWLWRVFGQVALQSGGAGPTALPRFPFGGLVAAVVGFPLAVRWAYLLAFGPTILLPLALGLWWLRQRLPQVFTDPWIGLFFWQALFLAFMPMASWDVFAVVRLSIGMLVGFWALALREGHTRTLLRLLPFWVTLLALLPAR